jgi:imidazolonepropionase-like amidohydrolase
MREQILLKNVNLLDVEKCIWRDGVDILIGDDRIKQVGKIDAVDEGSHKRIDCSHKYALSGLFECHAHLTVLTNQPDKDKKEILEECGLKGGNASEELDEQVLREFVNKGITQIRDCGGPVEVLKDMRDKIQREECIGPDLFYAGPMLDKSPLTGATNNERYPGFTVAVDTKVEAESIIEQISSHGASLVKAFSKLDREVLKHLLKKAKDHNLPVTFDPGKTFFHPIPVDRAIDLGIRCIEHGKSPWWVVLKDDLKSEHDKLTDADPIDQEGFIQKLFSMGTKSISINRLQQLTEKMHDADVYLCPTLHVFRHYAEHPEQFNPNDPEKFKKRFETLYEVARFITREMVKEGIKVLVGQDGWDPLFTHDEMQELSDIGLSESEIIKGATVYPARWLGIDAKFGSISPNKKANILILDRNPLEDIRNVKSVHAVIKSGRIVFQA